MDDLVKGTFDRCIFGVWDDYTSIAFLFSLFKLTKTIYTKYTIAVSRPVSLARKVESVTLPG